MSLDPRFYGPTILSVQKNFGHKIENFYLGIECGPTQSYLLLIIIPIGYHGLQSVLFTNITHNFGIAFGLGEKARSAIPI